MNAASSLDALEVSANELLRVARRLDDENTSLRRDIKKLADQLGDALDEVYALRRQVADRDQMIAELQGIAERAHTGGSR